MHAIVIDMPWKFETKWVLRSRSVWVARFIDDRHSPGTVVRELFNVPAVVSRYRAGTRAIREHFKQDRKAKRKAKRLQQANKQ